MTRSLFRYSPLDALLLLGALLQAFLCGLALVLPRSPLSMVPAALLFAGTVWWSANTVSHNHLHRPLFRRPALNVLFTWLLTLSTGVPQRTWRRRHLWHHAGERGPGPRPSVADLVEIAAVFGLWLALLWALPRAFLGVYLPGYLLAMILCQLQGHYEHAGKPVAVEPGVSYYGRLYNLLWWNDGYHGEHHRFPGTHWSQLPTRRAATSPTESSLPPVLRGLEPLLSRLRDLGNRGLGWALIALERLALSEGPIQRYMLSSHRRALTQLLVQPHRSADWSPALAAILARPCPRIGIVGGGLFPRTALILGELLPRATLVLIDASAEHLRLATATLAAAGIAGERVLAYPEMYCPSRHGDVDLLVFPLGYVGDRRALYQPAPGEPPRIVHEWLLRRPAGATARVIVSPWLLKQLCLVLPAAVPALSQASPSCLEEAA
jgi:hypothetical protein